MSRALLLGFGICAIESRPVKRMAAESAGNRDQQPTSREELDFGKFNLATRMNGLQTSSQGREARYAE
jgi:hypothetical protein